MAPPKRARPSFDPPRPRADSSKSKSTQVPTLTKSRKPPPKDQKNATGAKRRANGSSKFDGRKGTRAALLSNDGDDDDDDDEASSDPDEAFETRSSKVPRRNVLSLVDDAASSSNYESESDNEDETTTNTNHNRSALNRHSSPEPDVILAEVTYSTNTNAPVPEPLVHKMLAHHFERPEQTKISTDARDLVAKYIEVFVREAIMRSAFEREERSERDGGGGGDAGSGGGFLEVEDLERAAVQLCLDF